MNEHLCELLAGVGLNCTVADLRVAANLLRSFAGTDRRWSWQYIHQVLHGHLEPSISMKIAMSRVFNALQSGSMPSLAPCVRMVPVGTLAPQAALRICACANGFVANVGNRRYCYVCSPPAGGSDVQRKGTHRA